jgi:putative acetyltransferase
VAEAASRGANLEVEVNAQNRQAVGFYEAMGFRVIASTDVDGDGRPYPLLRMRAVAVLI